MSQDSMSGFESRPSGSEAGAGAGPKAQSSASHRFLLQSVFLGPNGVRAGWRAGLYVALFLLLISGAAEAAKLLHLAIVTPNGTIGPRLLGEQEAMSAACALVPAVILAALERRRFGDYGLPAVGFLGKNFWLGAIWGVAAVTAMMFLIRAMGGYSLGGVELSGAAVARYALEWAGTFFLVGVFEEFFFRGYLLFTLSSGMRFWPAAAVMSVIFGGVHLRNPGEGYVGALSVFVTGMFFCFTLRRTGTLWFAVGFHAAWDYCQTFVYSVPDSGIVMQGHLLASSVHGPAWLTGGTVGPEGSVFDFVIMALLFLSFDRIYRRAKAYRSLADAGPDAGTSLLEPGDR